MLFEDINVNQNKKNKKIFLGTQNEKENLKDEELIKKYFQKIDQCNNGWIIKQNLFDIIAYIHNTESKDIETMFDCIMVD